MPVGRWTRRLLGLAALAVLGLAIAGSGIVSFAADLPHPTFVNAFVRWALTRSVRTQAARTVDAPATDASGLLSAAGHYAATCAACHGAPGVLPSPVMQAAAVKAPDLSVNAAQWTDRELFWITKHGVVLTPMPAWPVPDRDDEVRRMAAFVRRLPGMTPAEYRALAYGPGGPIVGGSAATAPEALPDCIRCHGTDGFGRGQRDIPVLAGQNAAALQASLAAYATNRRHSGLMQAAAARVDAGVWAELALYFSQQPGGLTHGRPDAVVIATTDADRQAASLVARGLPEAGLPACASCHGAGKRALYPVLGGQKADYLAARLRQWQAGGNLPEAGRSREVMPVIARRIPPDLIEALARHYAGLIGPAAAAR